MGKVRRAIRWLAGRVKKFAANRVAIKATIATMREAGLLTEKHEKYFAAMQKLEEGIGSHTSAWDKIEAAAKAGVAPDLTADEGKYLHGYKKLWNRLFGRNKK